MSKISYFFISIGVFLRKKIPLIGDRTMDPTITRRFMTATNIDDFQQKNQYLPIFKKKIENVPKIMFLGFSSVLNLCGNSEQNYSFIIF